MRETPQALEAFVRYRDMGPDRSIDAVAQALDKSHTLIGRWSAEHGWVERVKAHEQAIADAAAEADKKARLAEIDKRRADRLKVAAAVRGKGVGALANMDPKELAKRPYAVVQMLTYADTTERLDMGEATERKEILGECGGPLQLQLGTLSDTDILARAALIIRARDAGLLTPGERKPGDD